MSVETRSSDKPDFHCVLLYCMNSSLQVSTAGPGVCALALSTQVGEILVPIPPLSPRAP